MLFPEVLWAWPWLLPASTPTRTCLADPESSPRTRGAVFADIPLNGSLRTGGGHSSRMVTSVPDTKPVQKRPGETPPACRARWWRDRSKSHTKMRHVRFCLSALLTSSAGVSPLNKSGQPPAMAGPELRSQSHLMGSNRAPPQPLGFLLSEWGPELLPRPCWDE